MADKDNSSGQGSGDKSPGSKESPVTPFRDQRIDEGGAHVPNTQDSVVPTHPTPKSPSKRPSGRGGKGSNDD